MRIDKAKISEETKAKIVQMLNDAEDKSQAIMEAMEMIASEVNQELVNRIVDRLPCPSFPRMRRDSLSG